MANFNDYPMILFRLVTNVCLNEVFTLWSCRERTHERSGFVLFFVKVNMYLYQENKANGDYTKIAEFCCSFRVI